jgi:rRNA maturation protein Nop10
VDSVDSVDSEKTLNHYATMAYDFSTIRHDSCFIFVLPGALPPSAPVGGSHCGKVAIGEFPMDKFYSKYGVATELELANRRRKLRDRERIGMVFPRYTPSQWCPLCGHETPLEEGDTCEVCGHAMRIVEVGLYGGNPVRFCPQCGEELGAPVPVKKGKLEGLYRKPCLGCGYKL